MLITNDDGNVLNDTFFNLASKSTNVTIASGYFGASQIEDAKPLFLEIAKKGGNVTLIHGMGMWEGIRKTLENSIFSLNNELQKISPKSGFYFYTKQRFHGKIYFFDNVETQTCIVGSSNFSRNGVSSNLEANLLQTDKKSLELTSSFLKLLLKQSQRYEDYLLPDKGVSKKSKSLFLDKPKDNFEVPTDIWTKPIDFTIPIRIQPRSSLNLTFGLGRKDTKGLYAIRPYYEVEITVPKEYWVKPFINFIPNQTEPAIFEIFTDNGLYFEANFKRKTTNKFDTRPLHETGGDFMSSPREALGKYIKDKLISSGALEFGEAVSEDTLLDYGNNKLRFKKLDGNRLYVEF